MSTTQLPAKLGNCQLRSSTAERTLLIFRDRVARHLDCNRLAVRQRHVEVVQLLGSTGVTRVGYAIEQRGDDLGGVRFFVPIVCGDPPGQGTSSEHPRRSGIGHPRQLRHTPPMKVRGPCVALNGAMGCTSRPQKSQVRSSAVPAIWSAHFATQFAHRHARFPRDRQHRRFGVTRDARSVGNRRLPTQRTPRRDAG